MIKIFILLCGLLVSKTGFVLPHAKPYSYSHKGDNDIFTQRKDFQFPDEMQECKVLKTFKYWHVGEYSSKLLPRYYLIKTADDGKLYFVFYKDILICDED